MTPENRLKITERQAEAWKAITTAASCASATPNDKIAVQYLLDKIEKEKKAVSRLIDSLPD